MEYLRIDPLLDSHPEVMEAGFWGARLFEFLLRVSATHDLHGRIPPKYQSPKWIARIWGLKDSDCISETPENIVFMAIKDLVNAGLLKEIDGDLVIPGWDRFYNRPKTGAERTEKWRKSNSDVSDEQTSQPSLNVTAVTRDATPHHSTPHHYKEKREKKVGADAPSALRAVPCAEDLQNLWNEQADSSLPRWLEMSGETQRRKRARKALKAHPLEHWAAVIQRINQSQFCLGRNDRNWRASPDWLLQPDVFEKVLEGKYDALEEVRQRL